MQTEKKIKIKVKKNNSNIIDYLNNNNINFSNIDDDFINVNTDIFNILFIENPDLLQNDNIYYLHKNKCPYFIYESLTYIFVKYINKYNDIINFNGATLYTGLNLKLNKNIFIYNNSMPPQVINDIFLKDNFTKIIDNDINNIKIINNIIDNDTPIIKRELFNENYANIILKDDKVSNIDKSFLKKYCKNKFSPSVVEVIYDYPEQYKEFKIGRVYPKNSLSIGVMNHFIRNPLAEKYYWDIDIENCHFVIAYHLCKKIGLKYDCIKEYIDNRNKYLNLVSDNRGIAKIEFLKILYGGSLDDIDDFNNNTTNDFKITDFMIELKKEMSLLASTLWFNNKHLHCIKRKNKLLKNYGERGHYILMSLLLQTEERKILFCIDECLKLNNRELDVYIHDGGYVRKLDNEQCFNKDLLFTISDFIYNKLNYKVNIVQKDIIHTYKQDLNNIDISNYKSYEDIKKVQEQYLFYIKNISRFGIIINNEFYIKNKEDTKLDLASIFFWEFNEDKNKYEPQFFFNRWLMDENKRCYNKVDFIIKDCPPNVYNLFNGLRVNRLTNVSIDKDCINFLLEHIKYLCDDNMTFYDYFIKWMASLFQHPEDLQNVALILKSVTEGVGKSKFIDFIGNKIIGSEYYTTTANIEDLFGRFANGRVKKILVNFDESQAGDVNKHIEKLKNAITSDIICYEQKGRDTINLKNNCAFIFTTNNDTPLKIGMKDRRFCLFDCCEEVKTTDYYKKLIDDFNNDNIAYNFYHYLLNIDLSNFDIKNDRPISNTYKEIQNYYKPIILQFIEWYCYESECEDVWEYTGFELYNLFRKWKNNNGINNIDISNTRFGRDINLYKTNDKVNTGIIKKRSNIIKYILDKNKMTEYFINKGLIENNNIKNWDG